jgi:DNA-binding winged helix-turn-helix (wHTH) protein/tetratricopeptide (TPR) repeat protein
MPTDPNQVFVFPPFRLNAGMGQLFRGADTVALRPKTMALLTYLLHRPGQLVTKRELISAVWPRVVVHPAVLKNCVREIRDQLGDDPNTPRFIQTVHGRGYRLIAPVASAPSTAADEPVPIHIEGTSLVGRAAALTRMNQFCVTALEGTRQLLFVSGEAGIGKSALVESFLSGIFSRHSALIARGQCVEQYGQGEAFMPIIEILAALCRGPEGADLAKTLAHYAPGWLRKIPDLQPDPCDGRQTDSWQPSDECSLLATADAIDAMTAAHPLVLVIEDLQWTDTSTIELLSVIARRKHPARLFLILTYRVEALARISSPLPALKQELLLQRRCSEIALGPLSADAVRHYVRSRFSPANGSPELFDDLAAAIHARTDGHPLFMNEIVRHLVARGAAAWRGDHWQLLNAIDTVRNEIPAELQVFINQQVDRLDAESRQLIEVASLVGPEFSARVIPASVGLPESRVDEIFSDVAQRGHLLRFHAEKTLADGRLIQRYGFIHSLHQETIAQRLPPARRVARYREIAILAETLHGGELETVARELANLFRFGRHFAKACHYEHLCGQRSFRIGAYAESRVQLTNGLELLNLIPESAERLALALSLRATLVQVLVATHGWAATETGEALSRARELGETLAMPAPDHRILFGLIGDFVVRCRFDEALALCRTIIERASDAALLIEAHGGIGDAQLWTGQFAAAIESYDQVIDLCRSTQPAGSPEFGRDPVCSALVTRAIAQLLGGKVELAQASLTEGLEKADASSQPYMCACANTFAAMFHQLAGNVAEARRLAERAQTLAAAHHLPVWDAMAQVLRGWSLAKSGDNTDGIRMLQEGIEAWRATGATWGDSYFPVLLAEVCSDAGRSDEATALLATAQRACENSGEKFYASRVVQVS